MNDCNEKENSALSTEILSEEAMKKLQEVLSAFIRDENMIKNLTTIVLIDDTNAVLLHSSQKEQQPIELKIYSNAASCIRTWEIKRDSSGSCCAYWVDTCSNGTVVRTKIICEGTLYPDPNNGSYIYSLERTAQGRCCAYQYTKVIIGGNPPIYTNKTLLKCE